MDRVAPVVEADRIAPDGLVPVEVLQGDDPVAALHLGHDQPGGLSPVEVVGTFVAQPGEDPGQIGLLEGVPDRGDAAARKEHACAGRERADAILGRIQRRDEAHGHLEAAREVNGRLHHLRPGKDTEAPVRLPQPGDRPGEARRQVAHHGPVGHVPGIVEVHVPRRRHRCLLPVIERVDGAVGEADHHEPAAAQIPCFGVHHRERQTGGDRRVDRVAARHEDVHAHPRRVLVGGRNHSPPRGDGRGVDGEGPIVRECSARFHEGTCRDGRGGGIAAG